MESAKNLGVILDSTLSFDVQIQKLVKSCFITIRQLWKVKEFLTQQHLQLLVSSLIFTLLDYCNSLYYGLPASATKKLQHVQNCAARLVWKKHIPIRSSLDHVFESLHWLKIKYRIIYKIIWLVYCCLHDRAPEDVAALITYAHSDRSTKLQVTRVNNSYGERAFSHIGPKLWNLLPKEISEEHDLTEFKQKLKSFLLTRGEEFVEKCKRR